MVGDLIGSGEAQERGIVGETPNLAARLQGIAEPNMVVIAEGTRKLLGNLFELEDLGAKELKGITGPVRAWAALRASSAEGRFEALHTSGLTELVGREEELELLLRRWSKAKTGEGQVVLLSGEAGIGKSRLTAALLERVATEPHTRLRYFCSPQHTDSALSSDHQPDGTRRRIGARRHRASEAGQTRCPAGAEFTPTGCRAVCRNVVAPKRWTLSDARSRPAATPTEHAGGADDANRGVSANPILMIFEDVHWIDPTSLEALGRTVDRIKTLPVLLIVTYRPEFEPPWIGQPHVTAFTLNRLGEREIAAMVDRVVGNKALPANVRQEIIERTDGIPLFVEEMTKAVLEAESEARPDGPLLRFPRCHGGSRKLARISDGAA